MLPQSDSLAGHPDDQLARLQQLVARRADELALEIEERPDDLVLWTRAEAEVFSRHRWEADGSNRTLDGPGRNPRSS